MDIELKFEVLEEVTREALNSFHARLLGLETNVKVKVDELNTSLQELKRHTEEEHDDDNADDYIPEEEVDDDKSPPFKKKFVKQIKGIAANNMKINVPRKYSDLGSELKKTLEPFRFAHKDHPQNLLTEAQNIFIAHFVGTRPSVSGKSVDTHALLASGIENGMWFEGWTPKGCQTSLFCFLQEKIKGIVRKNQKKIYKEQMLNTLDFSPI